MNTVRWHQLGLVEYQQAWDLQHRLFNSIVQQKLESRNHAQPQSHSEPNHYLLFCEHPHVYTIGKSGDQKNLLLSEQELRQKGITYFPINRGGDITYHGPGQLVMYPIFDLDHFYTDIHRYLRELEEAVIRTLLDFGVSAGRLQGYTGVWIDPEGPGARKICAMGIRASRWVTMHGIGFNINTNLSYFNHIIPCGIREKAVTSLQQELGYAVPLEQVSAFLLKHMAGIFGFIPLHDPTFVLP
jgi:lipoyl(octanoyl) transferase